MNAVAVQTAWDFKRFVELNENCAAAAFDRRTRRVRRGGVMRDAVEWRIVAE
jgi:hypothetical protein